MSRPPRAAAPRPSAHSLAPEALFAGLTCYRGECRCHDESNNPRYLHCPAFNNERADLVMTVQGNQVSVKCESGCSLSEIMVGLRRRGLLNKAGAPGEAGQDAFSSGLTVRELAESVRVDPAFLDYCRFEDCTLDGVPAVRICYPDYAGKIVAVRYYTALSGKDRLRWRRGDRPLPLSLPDLATHRKEEHAVLVDNEVDWALLWDAGFMAAAVPGPRDWNDECLDHLWGLKLYLWPSPAVLALAERVKDHPWGVRIIQLPPDFQSIAVEHNLRTLESYRERLFENTVDVDEYLRSHRDEQAEELEAQAAPILESDDPLALVEQEIRRLGYGGDIKPALVVYLAATSRLCYLRSGAMAVHMLLIGPPSGGKSWTVRTVLRLLPEDCYHVIDAGSPRALIYDEADLKHRVLVFGEADSLPPNEDGAAASAIRNLLQDNYLHYQVTEKSPETGAYATRDILKDGPTVLITTAVRRLGEQLMTRLFTLEIADHPAQMQAALRAQARLEAEGMSEPDPGLVAFQAYLQARAPWDVAVPFAGVLAEALGRASNATRTTRDFARLLSLIKSVAILRHASREIDAAGRVMATLDDYATVRELVNSIYEDSTSGATRQVREAVKVVTELLKEREGNETISAADVGKRCGISRPAAFRRVRAALAGGWLVNRETRKGFPMDLTLGESLPDDPGLPLPETLRAAGAGAVEPAPAEDVPLIERYHRIDAEIKRLDEEMRKLNRDYPELVRTLDWMEKFGEWGTPEYVERLRAVQESARMYAQDLRRSEGLRDEKERLPHCREYDFERLGFRPPER